MRTPRKTAGIMYPPPLPSSVVSEIHSFLIQLFSDVKMPSLTKGIRISIQKRWIQKYQAFSFSVTQNLHVREIVLAIWDHLGREGGLCLFHHSRSGNTQFLSIIMGIVFHIILKFTIMNITKLNHTPSSL